MSDQPDFPDDEPILPVENCSCSICRQLRDASAAAAPDVKEPE